MTSVVHDLLTRHEPQHLMRRAGMDPDPWQARLLQQPPHRGLVVCSRQSGKSTVCAAMMAHRAHSHPGTEIVAVSPTQRQSTLLVDKVRTFLEAAGARLQRDAATFIALDTQSVIYALPGGADTVRGYSPHLLVIDEAAYTSEALYTACLPMLAASQGDLMAISTPAGRQGWFSREWHGDGAGGWTHTEVPYTEIRRITAEFVNSQRASMTNERFAAEYECAFNSATLGLFDPADIAAAGDAQPPDVAALPDPWSVLNRNRAAQGEP